MIKFVFIVLPNVHLLDLAGPDQTVHESIDFGADFVIEYCGLDMKTSSSAGLNFKDQKHFSKVKLQAGDFIVIPGARIKYLLSDDFKKNKDLFKWLKANYNNGVNIVSICAGAIVLGHAGILDGVACTTHFRITDQLKKLAPKAIVKENILFVNDNGIYTSAGIASGIDLMLYIIEKLTDGYFAHKVARELVIYNRRDGVSQQNNIFMEYRNHIHSGVHKVQDHIVENIHRKNTLYELSKIACMSERNFTRVFKKETGITVNQYITKIRKENIKNLSKQPDLSRKQIAKHVGLQSDKQVSRIARR